jgi:hypothetical protein
MYEGKRSCVSWEIIVRQKYDYAEPFNDGLALVESNYKQSIINLKGKTVVRNSYKRQIDSSPSCGRILVTGEKGNGYLDLNGKYVIKPKYYSAEKFFHNRAIVSTERNEFGVIDTKGKLIVPIEKDYISNYSEGYAPFAKGGLYGYIDLDGYITIEPQYKAAFGFKCGLAKVLKQGRKFHCYVNTNGEEVLSIRRFSSLGSFSEGLASVKLGNLYGYINKKGDVVIDPIYSSAGNFNEGFAVVQFDNLKYGYINIRGDKVIDEVYPEARSFSQGVAPVRSMYQWGFINTIGTLVVKPMFIDVGKRRNCVAPVCSCSGWGYIKFF